MDAGTAQAGRDELGPQAAPGEGCRSQRGPALSSDQSSEHIIPLGLFTGHAGVLPEPLAAAAADELAFDA